MDSAVRLRTATGADLDPITDLLELVFLERWSEARRAAEQPMTELDRSVVAEQGGRVVGHTTALTRELTAPGAIVPAAHVTGVGVAPTHRRQGLLSALMGRQLTDVAAAGREPVALLWASEAAIYPRFGYGPASLSQTMEIQSREVRLPEPAGEPAGRLRLVDPPAAIDEMAAVYERVRPGRVGLSSRGEKWWRYLLTDHSPEGDGRAAMRGVLYEDDGGPAAYATWRTEDRWTEQGPDGLVIVEEAVADGPGAYLALWRFLLGIDLVRTVRFSKGALDEPLQYLVDDPQRLGRHLQNALWLRVVDLPAALTARQYAAPLDVVIEVTDPLLAGNAGRWRLAGGPGEASCTRTGEAPDFACSITELGAVYLGGTSLAALAATGRVRQLSGNLPSAAFGWHRQPSPLETF